MIKVRHRSSCAGFTLFELIVTLTLIGVVGTMTVAGLHGYVRQSSNAASMVQSFVKQVRAKAIARTASYRITASTNDRLSTSFADSCSSATFTADSSLFLELPENTEMTHSGWTVCVNSRGLASPDTTIDLEGDDGEVTRVEIMLGGGTRTL